MNIQYKQIVVGDKKLADVYYLDKYKSDSELYYYHNDNGPAIIFYDDLNRITYEYFYFNCKKHNLNDAAIKSYLYSDDSLIPSIVIKTYYFNGEKVECSSTEEYLKIIKQRNI